MARARARNFALTSCPISSLPDHNNSLRLSRPARSLPKPPLFVATFQFLPPTLTFPRYLVFLDIYHKPPPQAYITFTSLHHLTTPAYPTAIPHSSIQDARTTRAHHHVLTPSHRHCAFSFLSYQRDLRHHGEQHHHLEPAWRTLSLGPRAPRRVPPHQSPPLPRKSNRAPSS
jgi:hypothetical protein